MTLDIHKGARLRNRRTGEDCTIVDGPNGNYWAVIYDDNAGLGRYWVRPSSLEPRT